MAKQPISLQIVKGNSLDIGILVKASYHECGSLFVGDATEDDEPYYPLCVLFKSHRDLGAGTGFGKLERPFVLAQYGAKHARELQGRPTIAVIGKCYSIRNIFPYTQENWEKLRKSVKYAPSYAALKRSGKYLIPK